MAIELRRRKGLIYYWKNHQQKEVDFVIKNGKCVEELIQVTFANNKTDIKERETEALFAAGKELRCRNLLVITWDYEGEEKGIRFIPLWKWLLKEK